MTDSLKGSRLPVGKCWLERKGEWFLHDQSLSVGGVVSHGKSGIDCEVERSNRE